MNYKVNYCSGYHHVDIICGVETTTVSPSGALVLLDKTGNLITAFTHWDKCERITDEEIKKLEQPT